MTLNETYKQINEYGKNFHTIWNNTLKPEFLKHEEFRKRELASFRSTEYLYVALFIFCVIWLIYSINYDKLFVPMLSIISVILLWQIFSLPQKANKKFTNRIKSQYIETVMNAFAKIKRVPAETPINEIFLQGSELFADFSSHELDDAFVGTHKNVDYKIAEIKLYDDLGKRMPFNYFRINVFQGVVISFPSNKTIKNITLVSTRGDIKVKNRSVAGIIGLLGLLGYFVCTANIVEIVILLIPLCISIPLLYKESNINTNDPEFQNLDKFFRDMLEVTKEITLEDQRFMKRYRAFSSDEVEGRYLLTTAFMERLNNVRTAFGTNNLKCSFCKDQFLLAISSKEDLFELCSLFTPMDNSKYLSKFYNQIVAVLLLIDYFKLDEKTGL